MSVHNHLRLLTFNSIIEASHLGTQAAAILAIANCIKGISAEWTQITDQTGQVMQEVLNLEKHTNEAMEAFSEANNERLREAQAQTAAGLDNLRTAATFAASQAQEMVTATEKMQAKTAEVGDTVDLLDACFARIDAVLAEIESVKRQLEINHPEVKDLYDAAEVEQLFSASYTTEMERDVLRAALRGSDLPVAQQTFAGNDVELF
jgi:transcription antitermination factor NusG